jgi:hypothetical protein
MKRFLSLIGCAGLLGIGFMAGGCGSTAPPGYLAEVHHTGEPAAVVFVQITTQGSHLTGTWDETYLPSGAVQTSAVHLTLSGTESGNSVTIHLSGDIAIFGSATLSGTLSGGTLTLEVPATDGSLNSVALRSSDVAAYNADVAAFQRTATSAQETANAIAEQSASASAQASAVAQQAGFDEDVTVAAKRVQSDISGLQGLSISTSALTTDLQAQQTDLATMRSDEVTAEAASGPDQCSDADTVQSDADTVQSDADTVQSAADTVASDELTPPSEISSLQSDFQTLQSAEENDPELSGSAYLGLNMDDIAFGAEVQSVVAGSPAQAAGITAGAAIVSFNGVTIGSTDELTAAISEVRAGQQVVIAWTTTSGRQTATVVMGAVPLPTEAQVDAAVAAAQAAMSTATNTANTDVSQAQSVATSASSEATAFAAQYCS